MKTTNRINYEKVNRLVILINIMVFLISCSHVKLKNDWLKDNLKGKVQNFSQFSYLVEERFGKYEKGKREKLFGNDRNIQKKYDKKGKLSELNWYNLDGKLESKSIYKYDEKGNLSELNMYHSDGSLFFNEAYKYDDMETQIESTIYGQHNRVTKKFDDKGNQIEKKIYNSDGSLGSSENFTYEFDDHGNWIKRTDFKDQIAIYILERNYEYF
ncbi:MAG: hypothetical protein IPQ18_09605 [Saprospiraceae bacterium]|nr:hypothetical protein [Saprospiraceae bacterium]